MPSFSELSLSKPVLAALDRIGYEQPSPIQAASIPHLLEGKDLLGTAQTGTGKTAAFALPILSKIDIKNAQPQALVLAPTRELAIQVAEAFKTYAGDMKGFHVLPIYGGQDIGGQLQKLRRGVHVIVGTPGRVMDHLRRKSLKLDALKTVVLDEGDEMLRMGFIDDVTWILEHTPDERQVALFSATMPKPIRKIADTYLNDPAEIKIEGKATTVASIEQVYWSVSGVNKLDALTRILEVEDFDGVILFVRTKTLTVEVADKLEARGYSAAAINGDMSQQLRERTISHLKDGKVDILVATDVAARGIDVARISHVVNYDIPYDTEAYVHRIGRTGRAGRSGKAILFVAPRERRLLRAIEKATRQSITAMELPSKEQVNQKRSEQFKATITETLQSQKLEFFHNIVEEYLTESSASAEDLAAALAYMAQKGKPLIVSEGRSRSTEKKTEKRNERGADKRGDKQREPSDGRREPRHKKEPREPRKAKKIIDETGAEVEMESFRLAVGYQHEVSPGDIVGAIANEAGVDSEYIGRIELFDDYSTVDLPTGMPKETFQHLKKVRVRQVPLAIERTAAEPKSKKPHKKKRKDDPSGAKSKAKSKKKPTRDKKKASPKKKPAKPD
ncbi:MAG: DEAD/DEAH box helicase [Pseudomonadales bacterium]